MTFSPYFSRCFSTSLLFQIPLCFRQRQIHLLFTYFTCIFSPYFDHDAFMHHPMHVLEPLKFTITITIYMYTNTLQLKFTIAVIVVSYSIHVPYTTYVSILSVFLFRFLVFPIRRTMTLVMAARQGTTIIRLCCSCVD